MSHRERDKLMNRHSLAAVMNHEKMSPTTEDVLAYYEKSPPFMGFDVPASNYDMWRRTILANWTLDDEQVERLNRIVFFAKIRMKPSVKAE